MNEQYKSAHQQAVKLQFRFRDYTTDMSQPVARTLENQIQKVTDDLEAQVNPRSIEGHIQAIQRALKNLDRSDPPIMDNSKAEGLHDDYERLRMDLREMDNY